MIKKTKKKKGISSRNYLIINAGLIKADNELPFKEGDKIIKKPGVFFIGWSFINSKGMVIKDPLLTFSLEKLDEFLNMIGWTLDELKTISENSNNGKKESMG